MPVVEVSAGLVFRDGKLLLTRRPQNAHLGGLWEFPGGKRRRGEPFKTCLRRELREELGIEVKVGELVEEITHAYPERTVRLRFFRCEWLAHEPRPLGCEEIAWVSARELERFPFPAADARLIARLRRHPAWWRAANARRTRRAARLSGDPGRRVNAVTRKRIRRSA